MTIWELDLVSVTSPTENGLLQQNEVSSFFVCDMDATMLEPDVGSKEGVGLIQRFYGNRSHQSGMSLLEVHTLTLITQKRTEIMWYNKIMGLSRCFTQKVKGEYNKM